MAHDLTAQLSSYLSHRAQQTQKQFYLLPDRLQRGGEGQPYRARCEQDKKYYLIKSCTSKTTWDREINLWSQFQQSPTYVSHSDSADTDTDGHSFNTSIQLPVNPSRDFLRQLHVQYSNCVSIPNIQHWIFSNGTKFLSHFRHFFTLLKTMI